MNKVGPKVDLSQTSKADYTVLLKSIYGKCQPLDYKRTRSLSKSFFPSQPTKPSFFPNPSRSKNLVLKYCGSVWDSFLKSSLTYSIHNFEKAKNLLRSSLDAFVIVVKATLQPLSSRPSKGWGWRLSQPFFALTKWPHNLLSDFVSCYVNGQKSAFTSAFGAIKSPVSPPWKSLSLGISIKNDQTFDGLRFYVQRQKRSQKGRESLPATA